RRGGWACVGGRGEAGGGDHLHRRVARDLGEKGVEGAAMTGPEPKPPLSHEEAVGRVELFISNLLRVGVTVSIGTIVVGVVLMFVHHPNYLRPGDLARLTKPGAAFPHTLTERRDELLASRGQAVVCVGLLMLIATPILRVAVSIVVFLVQRDYLFTLITTFVLAVLLASFFLGKVE